MKESVSSLKIGSRSSELALYQSTIVKTLLTERFPDLSVDIIPISTEGDADQTLSISELGGKGVFVKGIESKLISKEVDIAVHSFKDLTSKQPDSLCLSGFLSPESQADVLVFREGIDFKDLKNGGRIGTGSLRRKHILKTLLPNCQCVSIRGNVRTRLSYLTSGLDAVMLSEVSLTRLNINTFSTYRLSLSDYLPAPGQGAIAIQCRQSDHDIYSMIGSISDDQEKVIRSAEYEVMAGIGFDCSLPLGMMTSFEKDTLKMSIQLGRETGGFNLEERISLSPDLYSESIDNIVSILKNEVQS